MGIKRDIREIPEGELEAELARRKKEKEAGQVPQPLMHPNWSDTTQQCIGYIQAIAVDGYVDEDLEHYIFEAAINAVYGEDVWKWVNKKQ